MKRTVTIAHLARKLAVHPSTISLGLRDSHHVSTPLKRRIHTLARRMGYSPNAMARSLRQRTTQTLGTIFPYATAPYYATMLDALYAETLKRGFHLEVCFHQWNPEEETVMARKLLERQVEGLILLPASSASFDALQEFVPADSDFPVAALGSYHPQRLPSFIRGCVSTDMHTGSVELGKYLLEMGHRDIALLIPSSRTSKTDKITANLDAREKGLREVFAKVPTARLRVFHLEDLGITPITPPHRTEVKDGFLLVRQMAERFLELSARPTVVVTSNEPAAHALVDVLATQGCRVPDDVSVACYDGTFLSEFGAVSLTCVKQPIQDMARQLVELVLANPTRDRKGQPEMRVLQPTLARRRSVARIAE